MLNISFLTHYFHSVPKIPVHFNYEKKSIFYKFIVTSTGFDCFRLNLIVLPRRFSTMWWPLCINAHERPLRVDMRPVEHDIPMWAISGDYNKHGRPVDCDECSWVTTTINIRPVWWFIQPIEQFWNFERPCQFIHRPIFKMLIQDHKHAHRAHTRPITFKECSWSTSEDQECFRLSQDKVFENQSTTTRNSPRNKRDICKISELLM